MKKEKINIKIRSLQANRIYQVQNGYKYRYGNQIRDCRLEWNDAMLNDSLFLRYMKKHGMKLFALETGDEITHFDMLGFTLQYTLC